MIFEKFSRLEDEGKAGGAGLGLAICRQIMGALGGDVTYPSWSGWSSVSCYVTTFAGIGRAIMETFPCC